MNLHRPFSRRERILLSVLGLLVVAGAYLLLVHLPTVNRLDQLAIETQDAQSELTVMEARQQKQQIMLDELEALAAEGPLAPIPDYDNLELLMNFLNGALLGAEDFSLNFQGVNTDTDSGLVTRSLSMSVSLSSYVQARALVLQLENSPYRCTLNQLAIQPRSANGGPALDAGPITLSAQLTFYELNP